MNNLQVVRIKSADICTKGRHPEDILSNFCGNDFCFEDIQCGCMESFLQSLKIQDENLQRKICLCKAYELDRYTIPEWDGSMPLWWKGHQIDRKSAKYKRLLRRAYEDMYLWCARFRDALMATTGKKLIYDTGETDSDTTILTDKEFCAILTRLRRKNIIAYKICSYPRMWPNSYGVDEDYEF